MAGFLRKKKPDSAPPPAVQASPPVNNVPSPLFARFATTAAEHPAQRVVSSPMALASAPRRDQPPRMNNGAGLRGEVQQLQQREDAKETRYNVEQSYVQPNQAGPSNHAASSASNGNPNSYGSPAPKRRSSPRIHTQTLPPTASPPPNRRISYVPGADKPLPTIHPQDNYPDPLGSTPPQSSLPANRRASTRGLPPQTSAATQNLFNGRVMNVPTQQPHISPPTRSLSNASPSLGTRAGQTPSARPNATPGPSQSSSRYPKEHPRQDLRHKLSDAGVASGGPPAIPVPSSPPRQSPPEQWGPNGPAPVAASAYDQVNISLSMFPFPLPPCGHLCVNTVMAS
ncbi:hypothetical protein B0H11DRAFT_1351821 [Mycena galericulata]|nr:hypothetical protein B0H11DRAFT_1351821 [Mycena galericulata]